MWGPCEGEKGVRVSIVIGKRFGHGRDFRGLGVGGKGKGTVSGARRREERENYGAWGKSGPRLPFAEGGKGVFQKGRRVALFIFCHGIT